MILVSDAMYIDFLPIFPTSSSPFTMYVKAIHNMNRVLFIPLQMFVKFFFSNRIFDISYNLNSYIQYKNVLRLFEIVCLDLHTAIALYCLNGSEKLFKTFAYPSNSRAY